MNKECTKDIRDLEAEYPDRDIQCLYKFTALYRRVYNHARKREQSLEDYLKCLGFIYNCDNENNWEKTDYKKLITKYPDGQVLNISKDVNLYGDIKFHAKKRELTIDSYIEKLGLTMIYPMGYLRKEWCGTDIKELENTYPEHVIVDFFKNNRLYERVNKHAHKTGISIDEYLKTMNFTRISSKGHNHD